jgi:integrase
MENISYDVRIWKMDVYKGTKVTTYNVRWAVAGKPWKQPFRIKAQAVSFEAELRTAASKGVAFDVTTGRPVAWARTGSDMSWYDFCLTYVDMKWKSASGNHRHDIAWSLMAAMPSMFATTRGKPADMEIRSALIKWAFNTKNRGDCPADEARTLKWLERNTKSVGSLTDPKVARAILQAVTTLIDGKAAAASTARRQRAILKNACEYAVEIGLLTKNPIKFIKWAAPKTSSAVDRRSVVNPTQARRLLNAVRAQKPSGPRLVAFYGVMYYAALRPEEALNLHKDNVTLPPLVWDEGTETWADGWGELRFCEATPEPGRAWTDDGARRENRQLKHRANGEWRRVPTPPPLTRLLRAHLEEFDGGPDGRLFYGVRGGELPRITYRRSWAGARKSVLTET